jgi:CBS-domain-containing membrane protein
MQSARIRRLPVVDLIGSVVGMLTLADIAHHAQAPLHISAASGVAKTLAAITGPRSVPAAAE